MVHSVIQDMAASFPMYNKDISIHTITERLDTNTTDILRQIDVLLNLCYIKFTNSAHNTISLTETGMRTIVPRSELYC